MTITMTSTSVRQARPQGQNTGSGSKNEELYALAARVPLMKSHSVTAPKTITLPPELHPLPADISAYFVYPFSLESYVLDPSTPSSATIAALQQRHTSFLEARHIARQERQREAMQRLAPGYDAGRAAPLLPTHSKQQQEAQALQQRQADAQSRPDQQRTPLDDLADHLSQLSSSSHT